MKTSKKIVCAVLVISFISTSAYAEFSSYFNKVIVGTLSASAIGAIAGGAMASTVLSPFLVPSAVLIGAAYTGYVAYSKIASSSTNKPYVGVDGDISVPANVTFVDVVNGIPQVSQGNVSAKVKFNDLQVGVLGSAAKRAKYPNLVEALEKEPERQIAACDQNSPVGATVSVPGRGAVTITSIKANTVNYGSKTDFPNLMGTYTYNATTVNYWYQHPTIPQWISYISYGVIDPEPLPKQPIMASGAAQSLSHAMQKPTTNVPIYSDYYGDIDDFIKDNPNVLHFEDGAPADVGSNSPLDLTSASPSKIAAAGAAISAGQAAASAEAAATNAGNVFIASGGNLATGEGGDPALYQKYLEEKAKADAANAEKDKLASEQLDDTDLTAPDLPSDNVFNTEVLAPTKKLITELLTSFAASSPLVAMVQSFTMSASGTGVVDVGNIYGEDFKLDFTRYEELFTTLGGTLLVIAHGFSILVVVRGW